MNYLPAPPTDNLYKFMAITGLWFVMGVLAYFAYLGYLGYMSEKESNEYRSYMHSIMMSQDISKRINQHKTNKAAKATRPDWIPEHFTKEDELHFLEKALENHQKTITDYQGAIHPYGEQLHELLAVPLRVTLTILIFGYILVIVGFIRWYKKVQQPQDELTKLEVELKKITLEKTKAEIKQITTSRTLHRR